jgi:predicted RNA-binding Zn ribbon-like protein
MEKEVPSPAPFDLSGGALGLDFTNTLGDRPHCRQEKLNGFADLLRWAAEAQVVSRERQRLLTRESEAHPRQARAAFRRAIDLREALYRIFAGSVTGQEPSQNDLDALNRELPTALRHLHVEIAGEGFGWGWTTPETQLDSILWPVVRSAAELLTSDEAGRIRECASDRCSWLFVDRSRTHRRRWCDMKICGNRAKARRHYRRKKEAS